MNEHDTLPPGGMGPLDPTDIQWPDDPECGHVRHWNDGVQDDGTGDWETCDECGRKVCFDIDCDNGWMWADGNIVQCYRCSDVLPA